MRKRLVAMAVAAATWGSGAEAAGCFGERDIYEISGMLRVKVLKGAEGETVKPYVLDLDQPACFEFTDMVSGAPLPPLHGANAIQIAVSTRSLAGFLDENLNRRIRLYGQVFPAHTAHHHLPVLISAGEAVSDAGSGPPAAARVVRSFYEALGRGNGDAASQAVIPEKRAAGPYAADSLTRFYGSLRQPLTLLTLAAFDDGRVQVAYSWTSERKHCDGEATVTVVHRDGEALIQGIKANC